jgi:hypothetical protein
MSEPLLTVACYLWTAFGASALTWAAHRAAGYHLVPTPVRQLLASAGTREVISGLVLGVSRFANLANEERRTESRRRVSAYLEHHQVRLSDGELNLLVELAYHGVKAQHPHAITAPPLHWGGEPQ